MSYPIHKKGNSARGWLGRCEKGFWGLDLGKDIADRSFGRAVDTENLIWHGDGLRLRNGYREMGRFTARINGIFHYKDQILVHAGNRLYAVDSVFEQEPVLVYENMADRLSFGVVRRQEVTHRWLTGYLLYQWRQEKLSGEFLFIHDGKNYLFYDGEAVHSIIDPYWDEDVITMILEEEIFPHYYATVPFTTVAKLPLSGNGDVDPRGDNYLTQFRCESFCVGTEPTTIFYLQCPFEAYHDRIPELVQVRDQFGTWRDWHNYGYSMIMRNEFGMTKLEMPKVYAGMGFMLDEYGGAINFEVGSLYTIADDGMDNYRIIYAVHKKPPLEISGATVQGFYGPDGKDNVLFLGGSEAAPGVDRFSAPDDFFCFYETSYEVLGDPQTPITGYCRLKDGRLAVLKNDDRQAAIHFRSHKTVELGQTQSGEPYIVEVYPSVAGAGVAGCINPHTVGVAGNEPCYLTGEGLCSVKSVSDELINLNESVRRSKAVDSFLEENESDRICSACWRGKYLISFGDVALLTDGLMDGEGNYRFLKWHFSHPISALSCSKGCLWLGGEDGGIYKMENGYFKDADQEIEGYWKTPILEDSTGKRMLVRKIYASCEGALDGELKAIIYRDRCPEPAYTHSLQLPDFGNWDFSKVSFSGHSEAEWIPLIGRSVSVCDLHLKLILKGKETPILWGIKIFYEKGGKTP